MLVAEQIMQASTQYASAARCVFTAVAHAQHTPQCVHEATAPNTSDMWSKQSYNIAHWGVKQEGLLLHCGQSAHKQTTTTTNYIKHVRSQVARWQGAHWQCSLDLRSGVDPTIDVSPDGSMEPSLCCFCPELFRYNAMQCNAVARHINH